MAFIDSTVVNVALPALQTNLNATAVELAEISLWLDTMVSGLSAPWFGLHLRRGNSLIGARRAVYRRSQVADKTWLGVVPNDLPLTSLRDDIAADRVGSDLGDGIHHFLLPADGWGAAADAKEAAGLVPLAVKTLKRWRSTTKAKPSKAQIDALAELADAGLGLLVGALGLGLGGGAVMRSRRPTGVPGPDGPGPRPADGADRTDRTDRTDREDATTPS